MIRLAVSGDRTKWSAIAPRLRGATIETGGEFTQNAAIPQQCHAVLIVESDPVESEFIERCMLAGKHVLLAVEQFFLSSEMLDAWSLVAQRSQVQFALWNPDRFLPSRRLIQQQLDAGTLGEPGLVRLHRWEPVVQKNTKDFAELPPSIPRDLDLTLSLMGKLPYLVYAAEQTTRDPSPGRCGVVHLGFPAGAMALIDYADLVPGDDYVSLSVIGSMGAAYADDHQNMQLVYRGGHPQSIRAEERGRQLVGLVQEFVDGLLARRDFSTSLTAWRGVLKATECVRRSLTEHRAIEFVL